MYEVGFIVRFLEFMYCWSMRVRRIHICLIYCIYLNIIQSDHKLKYIFKLDVAFTGDVEHVPYYTQHIFIITTSQILSHSSFKDCG